MAGSAILDSRGAPMRAADTLGEAVLGIGRRAPGNDFVSMLFTPQLALMAYACSGMLRKVIRMPAADRVREWRDWQADKEQIAAIEKEERRLQLIRKVRHVEVLRGVGGGALILAAPGAPNTPIGNLARSGLAAVNVVSRWQLTLRNIDRNLTSATYGEPEFFQVSDGAKQVDIHPSRVVAFRSEPYPAETMGVSQDDLYWGDSRLNQVYREIQRSDDSQAWFAALVKKAKLLRIGIPNIADYTATPAGQDKLNRRVALIAEGEGVLNATLYDAGNGQDGSGEKISDYQVTWNGIPAVMDAFDQRVAAVSGIPFTVLMGRSPAGMNATGDHDRQNWNREVAMGQKLELAPCLDQIDSALLPSAGVASPDITWAWAPLDTPTEKEQADTFNVTMTAMTALQNTGAIPDEAFAKGMQNLLAEREWIPGLDQALAEIPPDERFGVNQTPDLNDPNADPSAITNGGKEVDPNLASGGGPAPAARRRAANDALAALGISPENIAEFLDASLSESA